MLVSRVKALGKRISFWPPPAHATMALSAFADQGKGLDDALIWRVVAWTLDPQHILSI